MFFFYLVFLTTYIKKELIKKNQMQVDGGGKKQRI